MYFKNANIINIMWWLKAVGINKILVQQTGKHSFDNRVVEAHAIYLEISSTDFSSTYSQLSLYDGIELYFVH